MRYKPFKSILAACLLAATSTAWAHPAIYEGSALSNLIHLLTEPDHLLMLAGIGLVAGILWRIKSREL